MWGVQRDQQHNKQSMEFGSQAARTRIPTCGTLVCWSWHGMTQVRDLRTSVHSFMWQELPVLGKTGKESPRVSLSGSRQQVPLYQQGFRTENFDRFVEAIGFSRGCQEAVRLSPGEGITSVRLPPRTQNPSSRCAAGRPAIMLWIPSHTPSSEPHILD